MTRTCLVLLALLAVSGCKKDAGPDSSAGGEMPEADDHGRCPKPGEDDRALEASVYDTDGDGKHDVRNVFRVYGEGRERRLVILCREADLNRDGRKDVARFYGEDGSPAREESDRNFDGSFDAIAHYDGGRLVMKELDEDFDGRFETRIYYEDGAPNRIERDLAGRDPKTFRADRWEYVEGGRVVRIGTDLDGDGKVDRWDRDADLEAQRRLEERRARRPVGESDDEDEPSDEDAE